MWLRQASDEEEVDEQDEKFWYKSERECDGCSETLTYTDEIFVLEVVEAAVENSTLFLDVLHDEEGGDLFPPYLMHLECWEEALEVIKEVVEDQPPMECEEAILKCTQCESMIGQFEPFISAQFGEIHVSSRSPSGRNTGTVQRLGTRSPVCLLCIRHVIEDHFEEWEDLLETAGAMINEEEEGDMT